ncbi:cryptochrome/photolyase family protein [Wenzhouxiangella sp. XN79A]|uniref:cryptochrome/photolyase family protein n=1 Tax=Wenzhouxiangella sp. XN79A TaxID=2724193 RepID=UPI00144A8FA5|nr:cryptochrome/photolyase family protein [Wenzhouxiangella sp. XN79A]NKI35399.1 cryptochrome/photolyase family protein [Wenzhouxiangella sp. XN79A]
MPRLCLVLGDQLSPSLSSLAAVDRGTDHVLMAELADEASYVRHHRKKIALIFAAMRHFAASLENDGHRVFYRRFDPESEVRSFSDAVRAHCAEHSIDDIVVTWPGEWRVLEQLRSLERDIGVPVHLLEDDRFVSTPKDFADWAQGRKTLRMEFFYREMRKRTGLLMDDGKPAGGQWNFDADNRRKWTGDPPASRPMRFTPDETTAEVLALVADRFDGFGEIEGFDFPVTRGQARRALAHFVEHALPWFGDFQDALPDDEDWLFHSRVSIGLNLGLLDPIEVCEAAAQAWRDGHAPINAVEGFIRQVIGWREFIRGIYWLKMPDYAEANFFANREDLPIWYWSGETGMRCLQRAIDATRRNAYAHHIQRLMVTGNFAMLLGVVPEQVSEWYLAVYADAFEWVELPNVVGMAMFADGGSFASKPYAASGKYIQRMGDHCANCRYKVGKRTEDDACPFNALYWDFLMRHEDRLAGNGRMTMMYRNVARLAPADKAAITRRANWIRANVESL